MNPNVNPSVTPVVNPTVDPNNNPNVRVVSIPPVEEPPKEHKKKKSFKGFLIGLILGVLIVLGIMFYLFNSGKIMFSKDVVERSEQELIDLEKKYEKSNKFVPIKLNKPINSEISDTHYYELTSSNANYDVSIVKNEIVVKLSREQESVIGPTIDDKEPIYKISNFKETISEIYVGLFGDSVDGLTLYVITKDGSLYYSNLYEGIKNSKDKVFNNLELVKDTNGIIKILSAKSYNDSGFSYTMLGVLKDGSYYDLSLIEK